MPNGVRWASAGERPVRIISREGAKRKRGVGTIAQSKPSGVAGRRGPPSPRGGRREIEVVLFDYGGTLFKATRSWSEVRVNGLASAHLVLKRSGLKATLGEFVELGDSVFQRYSRIEAEEDRDIADTVKFREIVDTLFPRLPDARRARLAKDANDAFWFSVTRNYPLRKSARRALDELKAAGLRMGVVSNHHSYESLVAHLEESGIHSHFEVVLASEREGVRKPNTVIFERSLRAIGAKKESAIFVGDSPRHDIVGARRAGLGAVLIDDGEQPEGWATYAGATGPEAEPDFVIRDLSELVGIVESLRGPKDRARRTPRPSARREKIL